MKDVQIKLGEYARQRKVRYETMQENEIKDLRSAKDYVEIGAALVRGLEDGFKGVYRSSEQEIFQDSKSCGKDNPTLGKSTKYSQEEYNPSNIGVNR